MHIFVGSIWWNFHVVLKLRVNDGEIMSMSRGRPTYGMWPPVASHVFESDFHDYCFIG